MKLMQFGIAALCAASLAMGQADNTRKNKNEGSTRRPTAEQQMENAGDLELTRKIRKSITDDKTLSTYGKNVKIISRMGKVTLKGPVNTEAEKMKIEELAKAVAGAENITNEIEIVKKTKESR